MDYAQCVSADLGLYYFLHLIHLRKTDRWVRHRYRVRPATALRERAPKSRNFAMTANTLTNPPTSQPGPAVLVTLGVQIQLAPNSKLGNKRINTLDFRCIKRENVKIALQIHPKLRGCPESLR